MIRLERFIALVMPAPLVVAFASALTITHVV
jgi:hypothetical protein